MSAPTNQEITDMMNDIYGNFWKKWRDKNLSTDDEWDKLIAEAGTIGRKYDKLTITDGHGEVTGTFAAKLIVFFITVFEERERDKRKVG